MRTLSIILLLMVAILEAQAQDFVTKYRELCKGDTCLHYVCVSPKMIEQMLGVQKTDRIQEVHEVLKYLKSMQVIRCDKKPDHYYARAEEVLDKNANRFVPFTSYEKNKEKTDICIRKKKDVITELVLIHKTEKEFTAINFTGSMSEDLFLQIAQQFTPTMTQMKEAQ